MSVFKAYDIRGVFGSEFDAETVYRVGRCLPGLLDARRVLVGRDARVSSPVIREALCRGLTEAGADVDDMGLATTPMVYCFTARDGYDASVQITASHNPPEYNGLKISTRGARPVGLETGLPELERRVGAPALPPAAARQGQVRQVSRVREFVDFLRPWIPDLTGLRLAVDCSDGMAGLVAHDLFGGVSPQLPVDSGSRGRSPSTGIADGAAEHGGRASSRATCLNASPAVSGASGGEVIYLNDTPDGTFPHHAPNPLDVANCRQIMEVVRRERLDAGVIFDGDADRVIFIDETGGFIQPDYLIPIIARRFLRDEPGATVIHDIRTSRGVIETLIADGARPVMWKVGHAYAKVKMRETGAVCGGELAGHYYFRDFFHCDSGELAALIVLGELVAARRRGLTFSQLLAPIRRYANSGEINYTVARKAEAIAAVCDALRAESPPRAAYDFDGWRLEFADWWISIRPSNTETFLRVVLEAGTPARLAERRVMVERLLAAYRT